MSRTRHILPCALALCAIGLTFPTASMASGDEVIRDCARDGDLDGDYSRGELEDAERDLPSDLDEYTDCRAVIREAQAGGSGSSGGGSGSGGPGGGNPGGGSPGVFDFSNTGTPAQDDASRRRPRPTSEELNELDQATNQQSAEGPEVVFGDVAGPGSPIKVGDAGSDLPLPLLLLLIAVAAAGCAASWRWLRRRPEIVRRIPGIARVRTPRFLRR